MKKADKIAGIAAQNNARETVAMKNRFIVSILEALQQISNRRPVLGRPEVQKRLSILDNMAWQLLDDIKSNTHPDPKAFVKLLKRAQEQHRLSCIERN